MGDSTGALETASRPAHQDVFPRPREADLRGAGGECTETSAEVASHLPAQGYEIIIDERGSRVRYADDAGLRYARQTLEQLAVSGRVGCGRIRDWPDFVHRGFMLDISRDRVPTLETLVWLADRLATLRYNHLELYTEHTFAYTGHDVVWRDASPITPDELRQLDEVCLARGIELSANQNTFGHMDRWLRHPDYNERAECPGGLRETLPPWSLEPTPENATFALGLVREMASCLTANRVHIGADEPFDLGFGKTSTRVAERGRTAVYLEHLRRLTDPLIDDGYEVLFWGDPLVRHPEMVPLLPREGARAVVWNYDPPNPDEPGLDEVLGPDMAEVFGVPAQANLGFASYVRSFADADFPIWVAPGTLSWNSFIGRSQTARENLNDAAVTGMETGAEGYLVTNWGNLGHPEPLPVSLPAAAYGAGVAWCRAANEDADVAPVVDGLLSARRGVGATLEDLGMLYRTMGLRSRNGSPLRLTVAGAPRVGRLEGQFDRAGAEAAEQRLEGALEAFSSVPFDGPRGALLAAELVAACRLARQGLHRLVAMYGPDRCDQRWLDRDLSDAIELQRTAWLGTSRSGGLEDGLEKIAPAEWWTATALDARG